MRLGYIIAYVPDVAASAAFWERAFGIATRFVHETQYAELETGATALAFVSEAMIEGHGLDFHRNSRAHAPAGIEVALVMDDPAAAFDRAVAAGAQPMQPAEQKPWGQVVAYVRDADGILVELCTPVGGG